MGPGACKNVGNDTGPSPGPSLQPGIIAGIVIPCVVAVGALLAVVLVLHRRKRLQLQRSGQLAALQGRGVQPPSGCVGQRAHDHVECRRWHLPHCCSLLAFCTLARSLAAGRQEPADAPRAYSTDQHIITVNEKEQQRFAQDGRAGGVAAAAAGLDSTAVLGTPPSTPPAAAILRSISGTAGSEGSAITSGGADLAEDAPLLPVFEASPAVPPAQFAAWLAQCAGHSSSSSSSSTGSGSGGSRRQAAQFGEQLRRELDAVHGNPNLVQ